MGRKIHIGGCAFSSEGLVLCCVTAGKMLTHDLGGSVHAPGELSVYTLAQMYLQGHLVAAQELVERFPHILLRRSAWADGPNDAGDAADPSTLLEILLSAKERHEVPPRSIIALVRQFPAAALCGFRPAEVGDDGVLRSAVGFVESAFSRAFGAVPGSLSRSVSRLGDLTSQL